MRGSIIVVITISAAVSARSDDQGEIDVSPLSGLSVSSLNGRCWGAKRTTSRGNL